VPRGIDWYLSTLLSFLAGACLVLLLLVLAFLLIEAWPALNNSNWRAFFQDQGWYPLEGMFGIAPMIWASLAITLGAILLALPLGLASAIFMQFYAPKSVAKGYRLIINLLAGIPSVIYGLWGLTELVPLLAQFQPPGVSLLAAILVLTLMILPTIAMTSSSALAAVPSELLKGALALGFTHKTKIISVAIPSAKAGIVSGVLLAIARALGETMAVLMVAGNVVQNPAGLFEPVRALTANIALEIAYATGVHRASLFASGLLLTLLVLLLSWLAARVISKSYNISSHA
jgi:phosphate transport system permease protein